MARPTDDRREAAERSATGAGPSALLLLLALLATAYFGVALWNAGFGGAATTLRSSPELAPIFAGALALIAVAAQTRWRTGLVLVLIASFAAQLNWASWVDPQPLADVDQVWPQARSFADAVRFGTVDLESLYRSGAPSAVVVYGGAILLFGDDLSVLRVLAAGMWTLQTLLVWRIASEIAELRRAAFAAALTFGLSPTVIVFGALPSIEALSGLLILTAFYLVLTQRRRGLAVSVALCGALGALAFLAQPVAAAALLGVPFALLFNLLRGPGAQVRLRVFGALLAGVAGFAVGAAPQAALNYTVAGEFSIAPGPAIGEQLLLGTNSGAGAAEDLSRAGFDRVGAEDGPTLREADLAARALAVERISTDPAAFLRFAFDVKMADLWTSAQPMLDWSERSPALEPGAFAETALGRIAAPAIDGVFLAAILAACLGCARLVLRLGSVRDPVRWMLLLFGVVSLGAAHVFVETSPRDHLAFAPFLALLAPFSIVRISDRRVAAPSVAGAQDDPAVLEPLDEDPRPLAERSQAERLAYVIRNMSKPPKRGPDGRRADDGSSDGRDGGPAAAA